MAQTTQRGGGKAAQGSRKQAARKAKGGSDGAGDRQQRAKDEGSALSHVASKAKLPLIAGGAAVAGAAGGAALAHRQSKHGGSPLRKPRMKIDSHELVKAVGDFGSQVGALASELRRTREAADAEDRPTLELLLRGLAARR